MSETSRRREKQQAYNAEHNITPRSTSKSLTSPLDALYADAAGGRGKGRGKGGKNKAADDGNAVPLTAEATAELIATLEKDMRAAARDLEFERAAEIRDRIRALRERLVALPE